MSRNDRHVFRGVPSAVAGLQQRRGRGVWVSGGGSGGGQGEGADTILPRICLSALGREGDLCRGRASGQTAPHSPDISWGLPAFSFRRFDLPQAPQSSAGGARVPVLAPPGESESMGLRLMSERLASISNPAS